MKKPMLLVVAIIIMMLATTVNSTAQQKMSKNSSIAGGSVDSLVLVQKIIDDAITAREEVSGMVMIVEQFISLEQHEFDSLYLEFRKLNPDSAVSIYEGASVSKEQELEFENYMAMSEERSHLIISQMEKVSSEKEILLDRFMNLQTKYLELTDLLLKNYDILVRLLRCKEENKN